jgi:hypothetical protein
VLIRRIGGQDGAAILDPLLGKYGIDVVSSQTHLAVEDLLRWKDADELPPRAGWALHGFCLLNQEFDLLESHSPPLPSFDLRSPVDFAVGPIGSSLTPPDFDFKLRRTTLAGKNVGFPFGIGASVLTRNWQSISFYANRGFDILTYKTVRTIRTDSHPFPNWVFLHSETVKSIEPPFAEPVVGDLDYWPEDPSAFAMANSFGIPSLDPAGWADSCRERHCYTAHR